MTAIFTASFWVDDYITNKDYYFYTKEQAIRQMKTDADNMKARYFSAEYKGSGKSVGSWEKQGSRWYRR